MNFDLLNPQPQVQELTIPAEPIVRNISPIKTSRRASPKKTRGVPHYAAPLKPRAKIEAVKPKPKQVKVRPLTQIGNRTERQSSKMRVKDIVAAKKREPQPLHKPTDKYLLNKFSSLFESTTQQVIGAQFSTVSRAQMVEVCEKLGLVKNMDYEGEKVEQMWRILHWKPNTDRVETRNFKLLVAVITSHIDPSHLVREQKLDNAGVKFIKVLGSNPPRFKLWEGDVGPLQKQFALFGLNFKQHQQKTRSRSIQKDIEHKRFLQTSFMTWSNDNS